MGTEEYRVLNLKFSDGTVVRTINGHRFFDVDKNKFVVIGESNVSSYVGDGFVKLDGGNPEIVKLVDYSVDVEYTTSYSIMSAFHYNAIVEGMLTDTFHEEDAPLFEYFTIGDNLKFDEDMMNADIEKYGLYTYEEFADYLTFEQFVALNIQYMKISVGKGKATFDKIIEILKENGVNYEVDKYLVRGLDYYTGLIYEFDITLKDGKTLTIGGGGRYSSLVKELDGPDLNCVGFGIGVNRLALVLADLSWFSIFGIVSLAFVVNSI